MSSSLWRSLAVLAAVCLTTGTAAAQVCGDADASGAVTVTDGVQVLRQAAGLSSACTVSACDVDGNGSVTVTDGVNVLRKAAGLAITENCPGGVGGQVQNLLRSSLPIFGSLTKLGSAGSASAAATIQQQCDNADGFVTINQDTGEIDFNNCDSVADGVNYNGSIIVGSDSLQFGITITDLSTGASEALDGSFTEALIGQDVAVSGSFGLTSELGSFAVAFDRLVTDPNTLNFVGGSLAFSVQTGQLSVINDIQLSFNPSNVAFVQVDLTDGSTLPFNYDLVSGELTPISN
jgi:hypothetical protein